MENGYSLFSTLMLLSLLVGQRLTDVDVRLEMLLGDVTGGGGVLSCRPNSEPSLSVAWVRSGRLLYEGGTGAAAGGAGAAATVSPPVPDRPG